MSGSFVNSETTGDEMAWQEIYKLLEDGSFVKERNREGEVSIARGTYLITVLSDGPYLELTFNGNHELIENCTGDQKELLRYEDDKLFGTAQACDGPGLEYERVSTSD